MEHTNKKSTPNELFQAITYASIIVIYYFALHPGISLLISGYLITLSIILGVQFYFQEVLHKSIKMNRYTYPIAIIFASALLLLK